MAYKKSYLRFYMEGTIEDSAFFGIYAGLRMYMDYVQSTCTDPKKFSLDAAENHCRLQELKEQFPKEYAECEAEYNETFGKNVAIIARQPQDKKALEG